MKNPFKAAFMKHKKDKTEEQEKEYLLVCDFGYEVTSPIPSVKPHNKNYHCEVPAVVGTEVMLFPGERLELAEFMSPLTDEDGRTIGIKCRIKIDPEIFRILKKPVAPGYEVDLICNKKVSIAGDDYENGENTHTYYRLLLTEKGRERQQ